MRINEIWHSLMLTGLSKNCYHAANCNGPDSFIVVCALPYEGRMFQRLLHICLSFFYIFSLICSIIASSTFLIRYLSIDLGECFYPVFQIAAAFSGIYMFIIVFLLRYKIKTLFDSLLKIYNNSKTKDTYQFLIEANTNSEWIWPLYGKILLYIYFGGNITISIISVLFFPPGSYDIKYLYHAFRVIVPWNQKNLCGYFAEMFFNIYIGGGYLMFNGSILLLFISICLHHLAFYKIFEHTLHRLHKKQDNRNVFSALIEFHESTKKWFFETADIYSPFILIQLICNVPFLACVVYALDMQLQHTDFDLVMVFMAIMVSTSNFFVYCYFGKLATDSFAKMSNCSFDANWQGLPIQLQKYFILIIANTQRPLYYHGAKIVVINLETFTKLIKTVFTYYVGRSICIDNFI